MTVTRSPDRTIVWILGADARGTLFGVGELLRAMRWGPGRGAIPGDLEVATAPRYAIRGHQLGYRQQANSYDGWDERQFDQYIRELALFGNNSVEGIPHQDSRVSPVFTLPREVMNRRISESCARYDMDYWLWMPAEFDLNEPCTPRGRSSNHVDALFRDLPRLDAIFFPGGDPGNNPPELVIPYLRRHGRAARRRRIRARKSGSRCSGSTRRGSTPSTRGSRTRSAGVARRAGRGPSSPPLDRDTRAGCRDATRCGTIPTSPTRSVRSIRCPGGIRRSTSRWAASRSTRARCFYAAVHDRTAPYTDGFISYSDGVNDDLNKAGLDAPGLGPGERRPGDRARIHPVLLRRALSPIAPPTACWRSRRNWEGPLAHQRQRRRHARAVAGARARGAVARAPTGAGRCICCAPTTTPTPVIVCCTKPRSSTRRTGRSLTAPPHGAGAAIDAALAALATGHDGGLLLRRGAGGSRSLCECAVHGPSASRRACRSINASGAERGAVLDFIELSTEQPLVARGRACQKVRALPDEQAKPGDDSSACGPGRIPGREASTTTSATSARSPRVVRIGGDERASRAVRVGAAAAVRLGAERPESRNACPGRSSSALARRASSTSGSTPSARTRCG